MLEIHGLRIRRCPPFPIPQERHVDPGEPSCSPSSAAARRVYSEVAAYIDTLPPNCIRTRRRTRSTAGTAGIYVSRRETQEEFYAHSHEVSEEPQDTPGVLDEQRFDSLDRATVKVGEIPRTRREAPETPVTGETPRPASNLTFRATCFSSTGSRATGKRSPCGRRRGARYRASPGVAITLGRMIRPYRGHYSYWHLDA